MRVCGFARRRTLTVPSAAWRVDPTIYLRAFVLLARNPQIALPPLLAGVIEIFLSQLFGIGSGGGLLGSINTSIGGLFAQLISSFGLAAAIVVAHGAWRRGRAPFDDAIEQERRRGGDILFAAFGFGFVVYLAGLVGSYIPLVGSLGLPLVAYFFMIYTLPAAAIGGVPGGAAPNASLERARQAPLATLVVTAVYIAAFVFVPTLVVNALTPVLFSNTFLASGIVVSLIVALIKAVVSGYVALVLAKTYDDVSFRPRW